VPGFNLAHNVVHNAKLEKCALKYVIFRQDKKIKE